MVEIEFRVKVLPPAIPLAFILTVALGLVRAVASHTKMIALVDFGPLPRFERIGMSRVAMFADVSNSPMD